MKKTPWRRKDEYESYSSQVIHQLQIQVQLTVNLLRFTSLQKEKIVQ